MMIDAPSIPENTKKKVFVLSLHRSGTTSVHRLLRDLGYKSLHWPIRDGDRDIRAEVAGNETDLEFIWASLSSLIDRREAFSDVPFPVLYQQAARDFPDAKFVLVTREPDAWLNSVRRHIGFRKFRVFERVQYWHYFPNRPDKLSAINTKKLLELQEIHQNAIEAIVTSSDKLLSISLENKNVGETICDFLGSKQILELPRISSVSSIKGKKIVSRILQRST